VRNPDFSWLQLPGFNFQQESWISVGWMQFLTDKVDLKLVGLNFQEESPFELYGYIIIKNYFQCLGFSFG
jgi:hypothetical protein